MGEPIQVGGGFDRCEKCGEEYHNSILHECPPADPAGAARNECPKCGGLDGQHVLRSCVAPPASEAGHCEDSDEGLVDAYRDEVLHRRAGAILRPPFPAHAALLARLRQLRAEGERLRKTLQWRDSEVETHRRDSMQAREALAEAVQRAREEAAREERERCAKALQPWIDEPGKGMRAGPGVPPSIRMWAKYMQDEIRRQPPGAGTEGGNG